MKNKKIIVLIILLALFSSSKANAQDVCSKNGYTILTINGIFTNENGALLNRNKLKQNLPPSYRNEKIYVDYVYNATHLAGALDLVDAVRQGLFDSGSDYDLSEMLDSASDKVSTQKLLLVGHSQGNFYTNNFYDKVADKEGGVPSSSIGVYGVASPSDRVAGGGKYLTSDTDKVIATVVGRLKNILKPNTHIELQKADGNGHDFSDVYLKYRSAKIVSDIKSSLDDLNTNTIQNTNIACISPQKVSLVHEITGVALAVTDFFANNTVKASSLALNTVNFLGSNLVKIAKSSLAAVGLAGDNEVEPLVVEATNEEVAENTDTNTTPEKENIETQTIPEVIDTNPEEISPVPPVVESVEENTSGGGGNNHNTNNEEIVPEVTPPVVTPVSDTTPPVITLLGESIMNIPIDSAYNEPGATALDEKDGIITSIGISGSVDTAILGMYVVTYSVTDAALNTTTAVRIVNVVPQIVAPPADEDDEIKVDTTPPVITLVGANPLYLERYNENSIYYRDYVELGANAVDDVDGTDMEVTITGNIDRSYNGVQTLIYTATDKAGNNSSVSRDIKIADYVYIPTDFGTVNNDDHDWQAWFYTGSVVYDWSDTYVHKYLNQKFTIKTENKASLWCNSCLTKGIFKTDPRKGLYVNDEQFSNLDGNPQNTHTGFTYNVEVQWSSTGHTTTIYHDGAVISEQTVEVSNMDNDSWIGWGNVSTSRNYRFIKSGWWGSDNWFNTGLEGGSGMSTTPYPVYDESKDYDDPDVPAEDNPVVKSSEKEIISFNFETLDPKVVGIVNGVSCQISLTVPYGMAINNIPFTYTVSAGADMNNKDVVDFTHPVSFVVTAEDGSTKEYFATAVMDIPPVVTPPNDVLVYEAPYIMDYYVNNSKNDITMNANTDDPVIVLTANKNVNWLTITMEKVDSESVYKTLQSNSDTCVDGNASCTKVWLGDLSSGGLLQNGDYKIRVRIVDFETNSDATTVVHEEYLPITITVIGGV